jgi:glycosyltransferase involved in cell wall biosynthesis
MLSIVTVVKNDFSALMLTEKSIVEQRAYGANLEWILIDAESTDETVDYFSKKKNLNVDVFVSERDEGIYDAMNKGIRSATGFGLIFLNAGDYFIGDVLSKIKSNEIPCFLKVKYTNYFRSLSTRKIVNERLGISNCHQGIVFENNGRIFYDLKYKICADYKFFLDYGYSSKLNFCDTDGYVYWNQGISLQNWGIRDKEIFEIRKKHFGVF